MNNDIKSDLVIESASKVHEEWCNQEIEAYYNRSKNLYDTGLELKEALYQACYKNGTKRNEINLDTGYLVMNEVQASQMLKDFNIFLKLVNSGAIEIFRYTKREGLTAEEVKRLGNNYKNGEENILVDFIKLSESSKKENLDAAIGAANVFEEFQKVGISIEEMENNPEILTQIGIAIHLDWVKRNPNHPNQSLIVPYNQLDEWTQQQDITVFKALLETVKKNPEKYQVAKIEGYELQNYQTEEKAYFGIKGLK